MKPTTELWLGVGYRSPTANLVSVFSTEYAHSKMKVSVVNKLCARLSLYAPPLQVDLQPFDLESGIRV